MRGRPGWVRFWAPAYGITWGRAREAALTLDEHALELAKRPYDLRHARNHANSLIEESMRRRVGQDGSAEDV
ncbi:hypothetical protein TPA0905_65800 [Streptomyces olivaceus]|nr:hypothetical protein TPA0905_65800 [Streptomyces olivaceus]